MALKRNWLLAVGAVVFFKVVVIVYFLYRHEAPTGCWSACLPEYYYSVPSFNSIKRPVVMGMATGYRWPALRNFVISLRYSNYSGDIVLFISPDAVADEELMQRLRYYQVTAVPVSSTFPYFERDSLPRVVAESSHVYMPEVKAMQRRFQIMQLWLMAYGGRHDYVFITDTRDVVFQHDPFVWNTPKLQDKLYVVLENPHFTIGSHSINRDWVVDAFGKQGYDQIKDKKISCSGTTYGSTDQMLRYLNFMNEWILKVIVMHRDRPRKEEETVDRDIFDQAIHNYIIYTLDWAGKLEFLHNAKSPVITVSSFAEFKTQSPPLQVLNNDKQLTNVVHQYDRYPEVTKTFNMRYSFLEQQSFNGHVPLSTIKIQQ